MGLLLLADPSEQKIKSYLADSLCLAAFEGANIIGAAVVSPLKNGSAELMNIAVCDELQGKGLGTELLKNVIDFVKQQNFSLLQVGTGSFGYQLTYYQRAGFRVCDIRKNFFVEHYPAPLFENGIQHQDMLVLELDLT